MSLEIHRRQREGIEILELKGRITVGEEASLLRETFRNMINEGQKHAVLSMREVDFIDSTGLGALVMCHNTVAKAGGKVKLLNLHERTIQLLIMTKLAVVFEIFTDETDAVNSFFPGREIQRFDILSFVQQRQSRKE